MCKGLPLEKGSNGQKTTVFLPIPKQNQTGMCIQVCSLPSPISLCHVKSMEDIEFDTRAKRQVVLPFEINHEKTPWKKYNRYYSHLSNEGNIKVCE